MPPPAFPKAPEISSLQGGGIFPATVWTVVLAVREDAAARGQALETLCRRYWRPVYAWVRRSGKSPADAEDLTQAFFVKVLARQTIERVDRERGKFRSWLLLALRSFLSDEWDRTRARRRGGGRAAFSLDVESAESREALETAGGDSPEQVYDRRWAREVMVQARRKLGDECAAAGRADIFHALFPAPEAAEETQAAVAARMGLTTNAVKMSARRLRLRFGELIRAEVAQTVSSQEELNDEIRCLMAALSPGA